VDFSFAECPAFGAAEVVAQRVQVEVPLAGDGSEFSGGEAGEFGCGLLDAGKRLREAAACQALPAVSGLVAADLGLQSAGAAACARSFKMRMKASSTVSMCGCE
jgi:hypothetical protein